MKKASSPHPTPKTLELCEITKRHLLRFLTCTYGRITNYSIFCNIFRNKMQLLLTAMCNII